MMLHTCLRAYAMSSTHVWGSVPEQCAMSGTDGASVLYQDVLQENWTLTKLDLNGNSFDQEVRNQYQTATFPVHFVPGVQVLVFYFGSRAQHHSLAYGAMVLGDTRY